MEQGLTDQFHNNNDAGLLDEAVKAYVHRDWKKIYKLALRIALIHFVIGAAWILLSDKILERFTKDTNLITFFSIIKGWVYVVVMSAILYAAIYSLIKSIRRMESNLAVNHRKVSEANKDLELLNEQLSLSQQNFTRLQEQLLRKQEQLNNSEERYKLLLENTNDHDEINEYKEKLQHIKYHDQLTGLQNRLALNRKMHLLMKEKRVSQFALLYIDIDKFKNINDTMGHSFGDTLLLQVSERLKAQISKDALFRIGGDEFIALLEFNKKEEIERNAINILKTFKSPLAIEDNSTFITASIGVSLFPEHGIDADTLLRNADIAVYKAKESGRNRILFYNEPLNKVIEERMYIEKNLWLALVNNEFELYYQPQFDLQTDRITGFEALIRWNHSELGMVAPDRFISIAEDTHLIIPIGMWVLKTACAFLQKLQEAGYQELNMSVNISMIQLLQDDFVDIVMDTITAAGINAKHLELEITESILMESYESIAGKLKSLRAKGINIALDDFGKGYSSLNYLKLLPITTLKIDKVFIDTIAEGDKNFTDLIVKLGRSLDLCVIAEGVETLEQKDYLVHHKCNKMQGYLFSKPLPESQILQKMSEQWNV